MFAPKRHTIRLVALAPGDKLGPYEILSEFGRGGMATVFRAYQPSMGRHVAIKVLPEQFLHDPTFLARFTNEARVIAALEHPRILPVYDFGEAAGAPYIVMRLMPHGSLRDRLCVGPLPLPEVIRIVGQVAEALDFAHAQKIVHRDLKPDNVLLDEAGNVYLSDFGIAKVVEASAAASGTMVVGTPSYMAPEQARGHKPTPATDIYAMGAMTFELLAGQPPFTAEDVPALMYLHVHEPVPSLAERASGLPAGLQAVIEKAMAKTPETRFASAGEFARALAATGNAGAGGTRLRRDLPAAPPDATPLPRKSEPARGATVADPTPAPAARPILRFGALVLGSGALLLFGLVAAVAAAWLGPRLFGSRNAPAPTLSATSTITIGLVASPSSLPIVATATVTPEPSETPPATATQPATSVPPPMATIITDAAVRMGPSPDYSKLGNLLTGSTVVVLGRDSDGLWWYIEYPPGTASRGWVFQELTTWTFDADTLPIYNQLGTPRFVPSATATPSP